MFLYYYYMVLYHYITYGLISRSKVIVIQAISTTFFGHAKQEEGT